ncbi:hypothetical protein HID58_069905 [Brassica napus]|uniref:Uncharacterized protein n=1 Tax=Brassica napus TaxID=3708 RepID=A0ABQ7YX85_BRANA|nr:hypothetical protein HID58_069905 [Brassica napus]
MAASFEVKDLQKNRFTHPLSLSILHLEPFPRRDSNHHQKVNGVKSALLCSQGDPPDLWQPPGDGVSLWVNPGRGGGSQTYKEEYMLDIIQVMVLFSSWQNTKKHCRAPISTYVIWSFSGLKRESSHTHSVENVVLTRV